MQTNITDKEGKKFLIACYNDGYNQGLSDKEYIGRTWFGYYGWLDGKNKLPRRYK